MSSDRIFTIQLTEGETKKVLYCLEQQSFREAQVALDLRVRNDLQNELALLRSKIREQTEKPRV